MRHLEKQGQVVGKMIATLDGKVVLKSPLKFALNAVEEAGFFSRMIDHIKLFF